MPRILLVEDNEMNRDMLSRRLVRNRVNVEPVPGVLSTVTSPPSMVQKHLVIASPRPVPPKRFVVEASAWLNA